MLHASCFMLHASCFMLHVCCGLISKNFTSILLSVHLLINPASLAVFLLHHLDLVDTFVAEGQRRDTVV
jgi:NADH:ubiquinone oxidoreductase subunit K